MATPVIMPRQGQSVESCIIAKWHKQKGDKVSVGDVLFSYETDKATFEEEAQLDGFLLEAFYEEGDDVECLKTVCVIGVKGENAETFRPDKPDNNHKTPEPDHQDATAASHEDAKPNTQEPAITTTPPNPQTNNPHILYS